MMLPHLAISPRGLNSWYYPKGSWPLGRGWNFSQSWFLPHWESRNNFCKNETSWNNRDYYHSKRCRLVAGYCQKYLGGIQHPTFSCFNFCSADFLTSLLLGFPSLTCKCSVDVLSNMSVILFNIDTRLWARDFYHVTVDEGTAQVNYHAWKSWANNPIVLV